MKKITLLFSLALLLFYTGKSQPVPAGKVVLCGSYDETGIPSDINSSWDLDPSGGFVYILYSQEKLIDRNLTLSVKKKNSSGSYITFDSKNISYDPAKTKKNWVVYDYKFTDEGDFKVSFSASNSNTELASTLCNFKFSISDANEKNKQKINDIKNGENVDTYYFKDSKITLGDSVNTNAVVYGEATQFNLINGKRDVVVKLQQDNALNITDAKVEVYGGTDYKEKFSTDKFSIPSKTWNWIKVPVSFNKPGKYVVDIYNEDNVFINSAYLEIKR